MHSAMLGVSLVLGLVAAVSYAYAAWMFTRGESGNALSLIVTATITLSLIGVLAIVTRKKKG